jgi:NAD(P)-dependent dehydrogenase (short-subunit alcohol dehydrogenase family)
MESDDARTWSGKTAVITGAANGIGAGLARHAASLGMQLMLADIDAKRLSELSRELQGVRVVTLLTDVTDPAAMLRLADWTDREFGGADLVFNNAGLLSAGFSWRIDPEIIERCMSVNVGGVFNGIRAFIPRMVASGKPGLMVNTASVGGFLPAPLMSAYTASKFAVVGLTECLHYELKAIRAQVKVALLSPGAVKTGILGGLSDRDDAAVRGFIDVMRRMQADVGITPDELAARVFAGIQAGDYWIFPQPEAVERQLIARMHTLTERRTPSFDMVPGLVDAGGAT